MSLNEKLQECRNALSWTQAQVAASLKVSRELVTMWESGSRKPNLRQLEDVARLYRTDVDFLLGNSNVKYKNDDRQLLFRGIEHDHANVRLEIEKWLAFLDDWAEIVFDEPDFRKAHFPKELDEGPTFTDTRRAATKAKQLRDYFSLGNYALPDLFVFLDELNVTVCKAKLGTIGDGTESISGVYFNHNILGACILINSQTSKGRQSFTLAHEFAHALFHYGMQSGIVSRQKSNESHEFFANAFASNLLVPSIGLNEFLDSSGWKNCMDPYKVIVIAHTFRVSYAFMLLRLEKDGHINSAERKIWQEFSPSSLAVKAGVEPDFFQAQKTPELEVKRFPSSVRRKVKQLLDREELTESQVADLLRIDILTARCEFLSGPSEAEEVEKQEIREFAFN